jgi:hypothetical protein
VIGAQHNLADPPGGEGGRRDHGSAGAVGEQRRRIAIGDVEEARQKVRAHHERMLGATRLDLPAGHQQGRQPARAGRPDVHRARAVGAQEPRYQRGRVRRDLIGGRGGDEHDVEVGALDAGALERGTSGLGGEL